MALSFYFDKIENYREVCNHWVDPKDIGQPRYKSVAAAIEDGWPKENVRQGSVVQVLTRRPMTEAIVWTTIVVGIGTIKQENVAEFIARLRIVEAFGGHLLTNIEGPVVIPDEEVIKHIGLRTNVTSETRTAWVRRYIIKSKMEELHAAATATLAAA